MNYKASTHNDASARLTFEEWWTLQTCELCENFQNPWLVKAYVWDGPIKKILLSDMNKLLPEPEEFHLWIEKIICNMATNLCPKKCYCRQTIQT